MSSETARQRNSETGGERCSFRKVRTFRDLVAWHRGMELARAVYRHTQGMPESERFGLTSQMRRAAVAVPSCIAEGHARQSRADYLRFLRMARGSVAELATQVELATSLGMLHADAELSDLVAEEARILQALIRSLERLDAGAEDHQ